MTKIIKGISLVLVVVWLVAMYRTKFGHDALTKAAPDVVIVGLKTDQCPFAFIKNDQVIGFDVDLTQVLAERIGKKRVIKKLSNQDVTTGITEGAIHVVPVTNKDESFLFSEPYLENYQPRFLLCDKNNDALHTLINNALLEIKEDGTLSELKKKWSIL